MITFFTIPRPFTSLHKIIQTNAILSWKSLNPSCEILVFGDDPTILDFCKKQNLRYIEDFKSNEYGTPLLSDIWTIAKNSSKNEKICYINTDIILFKNFTKKLMNIQFDKYFVAGRRWDLDIKSYIDFNSEWEQQLMGLIKTEGLLHPSTGVDYFLFPKNIMPEMPPFAIGRAWWDNWLITYFLNKKIPVIDGTIIPTIHQNHDYSHVKSVNRNSSNKGVERETNKKIASLKFWQLKDISDCTHTLLDGEIRKTGFLNKLLRIYQRYFLGFLSLIKKTIT
tara:strand:+ start:4043 stop:4882 length:840 start_codon:yes stop_codon:yes gene_type:complete